MKKILVPTDFSDVARLAEAWAVDLAWRFEGEVRRLHVGAYGVPVRPPQGAAGSATPPGVTVTPVEIQGDDVAEEVLQYAEDEGVDLIVLGTHGHRSLRHPALGGLTGELVRRAPCPVLAVPRRAAAGATAPVLSRILVPVDFSPQAMRAVVEGKSLAERYHAELALLFVVEEHTVPVFSDTGLPAFTVLAVPPEMAGQAQVALEQVYREASGPEVPASFHVRTGHPAREIRRFVDQEEVDLVVMSTRGVSGLKAFALGSVTERTVRDAPCAVLTVGAGAG
jgi:nucleotide-binding universal stress UspA family protein